MSSLTLLQKLVMTLLNDQFVFRILNMTPFLRYFRPKETTLNPFPGVLGFWCNFKRFHILRILHIFVYLLQNSKTTLKDLTEGLAKQERVCSLKDRSLTVLLLINCLKFWFGMTLDQSNY